MKLLEQLKAFRWNIIAEKHGLNNISETEFLEALSATDLNISKEEMLECIQKWGIEFLYLGERIDYYSEGVVVRDMHGNKVTPKQRQGKNTIFKYEKGDYYYTDILDHNTLCEKISPGIMYAKHACCNLKSMSSVLGEEKRKINVKSGGTL